MSYILVVDDDKILTLLIEKQLEKLNVDVITAFDAKETLSAAISLNPSLILLDINMPKINGLDIIRTLKNDSSQMHIPIVAMSTKNNQQKLEKAVEIGANSYFFKPIDSDALLSEVRKYIA